MGYVEIQLLMEVLRITFQLRNDEHIRLYPDVAQFCFAIELGLLIKYTRV